MSTCRRGMSWIDQLEDIHMHLGRIHMKCDPRSATECTCITIYFMSMYVYFCILSAMVDHAWNIKGFVNYSQHITITTENKPQCDKWILSATPTNKQFCLATIKHLGKKESTWHTRGLSSFQPGILAGQVSIYLPLTASEHRDQIYRENTCKWNNFFYGHICTYTNFLWTLVIEIRFQYHFHLIKINFI